MFDKSDIFLEHVESTITFQALDAFCLDCEAFLRGSFLSFSEFTTTPGLCRSVSKVDTQGLPWKVDSLLPWARQN